ncbi:MAG: chromosomal replication initiator protein DnaA [Phycisphaerales bacterium]|nr:chromosomal replication initiator protein DnaA [Phycisphaerales bacterium]
MTKSLNVIWTDCLKIIKDIVDNTEQYDTWFKPIMPVSIKGSVLTIQVPSQYFYEHLEEHYVHVLSKVLKRVIGKDARLEYHILVDSDRRNVAGAMTLPSTKQDTHSLNRYNSFNNRDSNSSFTTSSVKINNPFVIPGLKTKQIDSQLNAQYTFDSFIEGGSNRVARQAGLTIAKNPGTTSFNPLVIYGVTGIGKTHLVQAIGNECKKNFPNKIVLYVSSEKFINQFQDHGLRHDITSFINFYQMVDVLIIDDVQFFSNKAAKSQEALFSIFNHLHQCHNQIIFTSDKSPRELDGLNERLLSRFKWGLATELQIPDYETRIKILDYYVKVDGTVVDELVIKYIANHVKSEVRELRGALISLLAESSLNNKKIDIELAKRVLRDYVKQSTQEITIQNIQKIVCDYFGVPYDKLLDKTRKREIVQARQITMFLSKNYTKHSLKYIGEHFGGKDHTTVIHSCHTIKNLMDSNPRIHDEVLELQEKVNAIIVK